MNDLERAVIDLLHTLHWRVAHFRSVLVQTKGGPRYMTPVAGDGKGFPDIVAVRDRVVFIEVKDGTGRLSPEQKEWRDAIQAGGGEWIEARDLQALADALQ